MKPFTFFTIQTFLANHLQKMIGWTKDKKELDRLKRLNPNTCKSNDIDQTWKFVSNNCDYCGQEIVEWFRLVPINGLEESDMCCNCHAKLQDLFLCVEKKSL